MDPDRWLKIEELFHAALEYSESQRAAFLTNACSGDDDLRHRVSQNCSHVTKRLGTFSRHRR